MAKDTFYFTHDYNSRSDEKIKLLIRKHGMTGYGIFWAIIEDLYNNTNALRLDYEGIAFDLRTDVEVVKSIINDFDLFVFDSENFGSLSVQSRIEKRNEISKKNSNNAYKRWERHRDDANALRAQSEGNAIKESKLKETKQKETKPNRPKDEIIWPFDSEEFKNHWGLWVRFKKEQFKFTYKSDLSLQGALKELAELSGGVEETAIKIINQSINKGWQGFFALKTGAKPDSNTPLTNKFAANDAAAQEILIKLQNEENHD